MHRVIVCKTYYQLIFAIQLKKSLFLNDEVDIIVSDHSVNAEKVCERLKKLGMFSKVTFLQYKDADSNASKIHSFTDAIMLAFEKKSTKISKLYSAEYIDELIAYNMDFVIYSLYDKLKKNNPNVCLSKMEEGIFSYNVNVVDICGKRIILSNMIRRFLNKKDALTSQRRFYVYFPELVERPDGIELIRVPQIEKNSSIRDELNYIFDVNKDELQSEYDRPYIFFGTIFKSDGDDIGEERIFSEVSKIVGKENIVIKIHPRDTSSFYADNGFKVASSSSAPWEVLQMNLDCDSKVFLTLVSGCVLAPCILNMKDIKTYYLFKLGDLHEKGQAAEEIKGLCNQLFKLQKIGKCVNHEIIDNIEQIVN